MENPSVEQIDKVPPFPEEVWHMGPYTYSEIMKMRMECGYGEDEKFAARIMCRYGKKPFFTYKILVHFDWDRP
jgi:hypothetical protein